MFHLGGSLSVLLLDCGKGEGLNPLSSLEAKPCPSFSVKEAVWTLLPGYPHSSAYFRALTLTLVLDNCSEEKGLRILGMLGILRL